MIIFEKVSKKFGDKLALDNLSWKVGDGEIVGLLGPNGAGKTTAMRICLGLIKPTKGRVLVNNTDVNLDPQKAKSQIGYLCENNPLYPDMKVWEYLKFVAFAKNSNITAQFQQVISQCGLTEVINQKIDRLSKGFRQRVGLAASLIANPPIIILDEPTVGLDPNQIIEIRKLIKSMSKKKTVILSSHILSEVQAICSKVLIIHKGKVVTEGNLKKITKGKSLEKIFQKLTLT